MSSCLFKALPALACEQGKAQPWASGMIKAGGLPGAYAWMENSLQELPLDIVTGPRWQESFCPACKAAWQCCKAAGEATLLPVVVTPESCCPQALRRDLHHMEQDVNAFAAALEDDDGWDWQHSLQQLEGRFRFLDGIYRAHSEVCSLCCGACLVASGQAAMHAARMCPEACSHINASKKSCSMPPINSAPWLVPESASACLARRLHHMLVWKTARHWSAEQAPTRAPASFWSC